MGTDTATVAGEYHREAFPTVAVRIDGYSERWLRPSTTVMMGCHPLSRYMFVRRVDPSRVDWDEETELAVVGGGGCGLTAAAAASRHGVDVTLFEKADRLGGKARVATGQICGVDTPQQREAGIEDSADAFYEDLLDQQTPESSAEYDLNRDLITAVAGNSGAALTFLTEDVGATLTLHRGQFEMPGHRVHRTHYPVRDDGVIPRAGQPLTDRLEGMIRSNGVDVRTDFPMDQLLLAEGTDAVIGVVSKDNPDAVPRRQSNHAVRAEYVLLACDGFGANRELVTDRFPELAALDYWGTRENTGDAIRIADELDLALDVPLYDMHGPFSVPDGIYLPNELVKAGAIIVNESADRFMDCGDVPYRVMDMHILEQPNATGYLVIDQAIVDEFLDAALTSHQFGDVLDDGAFDTADSVDELAAHYGLDADALRATIADVNGDAPAFGRNYPHELEPPFYAAKIRPMYVKAREGIRVDADLRCLRTDGTSVDNLYAGGNASESLEGGDPNVYIPGMDLLTALTEGYMVGRQVAERTGALR